MKDVPTEILFSNWLTLRSGSIATQSGVPGLEGFGKVPLLEKRPRPGPLRARRIIWSAAATSISGLLIAVSVDAIAGVGDAGQRIRDKPGNIDRSVRDGLYQPRPTPRRRAGSATRAAQDAKRSGTSRP